MNQRAQTRQILGGFLVALVVYIADQLSKTMIFDLLDEEPGGVIPICDFLHLIQVWNTGVSFGLFHNQIYGPIILTVVALCITLFLCGWLIKATDWHVIIPLSLVIGGALGNITDRLRFGAVADFLDFHILGYHWPTFNVADASVCLGVVLLLIDSIYQTKPSS
jgi:signal peptidase II